MFIVIDGIDGVGKSTQLRLLYDFLTKKAKRKVISTREPGGSEIAELIREILFLPRLNDSLTELFLYFAARRDHFLNTIKPTLDDDDIIICDRFICSTIAYQSYGFGIDVNVINQLHSFIIPKEYYPDITFILDLDVEIAMSRAKQLSDTKYEDNLSGKFFDKVRLGFIELSKEKNCYLIDHNTQSDIHNKIVNIVNNHCSSRFKID